MLTNYASRLPLNKTIKINIDNFHSFVMKSDGSDEIANDLYWSGLASYEYETTSLFIELLSHTKCFFDIGANTGIYSLIASSLDRRIEVHSFEPVERAFKWLSKNKELNNFANMSVNMLALSNFNGETEFNVQKVHSARIPLGSSIRMDMGDEEREIVKVKVLKLDTYINMANVKTLDLIKIDTEGTEDMVFAGAELVFSTFRPFIICEVLSNLIEKKLELFLLNKDYSYYRIESAGLRKMVKIIGDPVRVSNYLLVPKERETKLISNEKLKFINQD